MARLITKFKYLKPDERNHFGGYAEYIATREGVEKIDESKRFSSDKVSACAKKINTSLIFLNLFKVKLRLFLFLYAGLFVTFSFAKLGLDTGSLALTLKAAERAVKRLILFYSDFCHYLFPSPRFMRCEAPDCTSLILYPSQTRLSRIISRFFEKNVSEMYYLATIFTILPGT